MKRLAINGGDKIRKTLFPANNTIGIEEESRVMGVLKSGVLSRFLGVWHEDFNGGDQVRALESEWANYFNVKHAIALNSATSGLIASIGAIGISPGDEVIVSPYTMSASATSVLFYGGIPVFADIEDEYYCLDVLSIKKKITKKTKAIIVVDIFGQPYDRDAINELANEHNLVVIEDAAQAPGAKFGNDYAGTLGDIGVFSLNYHKHIHSGEGSLVVTNNDEYAERIKLIRNHAESVVENANITNLCNMVGFNFRMTEIEAAIAREQLSKLELDLEKRLINVAYFEKQLESINGLEPMKVRKNTKHVYYQHIIEFNEEILGMDRTLFLDALKAELMPHELRLTEGVKIGGGYVKPLYLLPIFQQKIAIGSKGWPFTLAGSYVSYAKGECPVCENKHFKTLISHEFIVPSMTTKDIDDVISAIKKIIKYKEELIHG